jgi:hypothetical protein
VPGEFGVLAKVHIAAGTTVHLLGGRGPARQAARLDLQEQNAFFATPEHVLLLQIQLALDTVFDCRVGGILQAINLWATPPQAHAERHFWRPAAHNKGTCTY